jgi:hypothetical protein
MTPGEYIRWKTRGKHRPPARAAEATAQAERISAGTIAGQSEFPQTEYPNHRLVTRVGLYNRSSAPIANAVVTLVLVQGAGPKLGVQLTDPHLRREFQRDLSTIPPGEWEVQVSPGWAGMLRRPGIEIAFTDQAGRNWVRYSSGLLEQIHESPAAYYRIQPPSRG